MRRRVRQLVSQEWFVAVVVAAALAAVFTYPLLIHLTTPGLYNDWDFSTQLQWAAYHSIVHFGQLPLWNPYKCGGMPLFGNPQSHFFSPWFLLTLIFGPIVGLHLEAAGHFFVAWLGAYLLGRVLRMTPVGAAGTACAFATSSWLNLHACEGHMVFLAIAYAPLIVALAIIGNSPGHIGASIGAGGLLALTFFEGAGYPPMFIAVMLALVLGTLCITRLSLRPLLSLAVLGIFAVGFAAIKLLPAHELLNQFPRETSSAYSNTWQTIRTALFSRNQDRMRPSPNFWGFHESGAYLGVFVVPAIVGLWHPRRALPFAIAAAAFIFLARGDQGPHSLWTLLHDLPFASSMRLPSRMLMMVVLAVAVLAGFGLDAIASLRAPIGLVAAVLLVGAGLADNFMVVTPNLYYALRNQAPELPHQPAFRQYRLNGMSADMFRIGQANEGVVQCYEYRTWTSRVEGFGEPAYRGEEYMFGQGSVQVQKWTPNDLRYQVDTPVPSVAVINQNYDSGWTLAQGRGRVFSFYGLIGVAVPAGQQSILLRYRGKAFEVGTLISLFSLIIAATLVWFERSGRRN